MEINIIYSDGCSKNLQKKEIRKSIKEISSLIIKEENINPEILNFIFCDEKMIREYNKKYLGHDYETDILTFFEEDDNGVKEGELLISIDTVRSNSEYFKTEFSKELQRVVIHGMLHLSGYKDSKISERKAIRKKEDYYLKTLNNLNNAGKNI